MKSIILKLTINFSHSDVNEESQIIGPDKIITFKKKQLLIKRQWSLSQISRCIFHSDVNEESQIIGPDKIIIKKKQLLQTSKVYHDFTMFSYSDENGDHKSFFETKSSHLRKITTVRRDLNEVYHFKTHDKFFTFRWKWGIINHWSRQNHHI